MGKEILTSWDIEVETNFIVVRLLLFLKKEILRKYYYLTRFILVKKTINTLLVTCMMIIKLSIM